MTSFGSRGALIVFEGCDRAGKTTQCKKLVAGLLNKGIKAKFMCFPDRFTPIGDVINSYLKKEIELSNKAIHLMFSANRWEHESKMRSLLDSGVTLVVDRYAHSGVAFSAAKEDMDFDWCTLPDKGLPKPDVVFFMDINSEIAQKREGFGGERYESNSFQQKVYSNFKKLKDETWKIIQADKDPETLHDEILEATLNIINVAKDSKLVCLW